MADYTWTGAVSSAYATAGNYTPAGPPADTDTLNFDPAYLVSMAGSSQAGIRLAELTTDSGYSMNIGSSGTPLIIDAVLVKLNGSGTVYLKSDDAASGEYTGHVVVNSPNTVLAAHLDGEEIDNISVLGGCVELAATLGTVAIPTLVRISRPSGEISGAKLIIHEKSGATSDPMVTTLHVNGGMVESSGRISTMYQTGGQHVQVTEEINTLFISGGQCIYNSETTDGTLGTAYVDSGGVLDLSQTSRKKTITSLHLYPGGIVIADSDIVTITTTYDWGGRIIRPGDPEASRVIGRIRY